MNIVSFKDWKGSDIVLYLQSNKLGSLKVKQVQVRYETSVSEIRGTSDVSSQTTIPSSYRFPKQQFPQHDVYQVILCLQLTVVCISGEEPSIQKTLTYKVSNMLTYFCPNIFVIQCSGSFGLIQLNFMDQVPYKWQKCIYCDMYFMHHNIYIFYIYVQIYIISGSLRPSWGSGEGSFTCHRQLHSLCPHMEKRANDLPWPIFMKAHIPFMRTLSHVPINS